MREEEKVREEEEEKDEGEQGGRGSRRGRERSQIGIKVYVVTKSESMRSTCNTVLT